MKEHLISIIMPVFNSENRLNFAIDSVLNQDYKNIELIIVNDGSTDNSLNICKCYSIKDERVKVFSKKNTGVSATRNKGIIEAKGELIMFIDSDDTIDPNLVSQSIEYFDIMKTDVFIYGMSFDYYNGLNFINKKEFSVEKDLSLAIEEFKNKFFLLYTQNYLSSACNKIFRTKIIKENKIFFEEKMAILEDLKFVLDFISYSSHITATKSIYYNYYNDKTTYSIKERPDIDYKESFRILDHKLREFTIKMEINDNNRVDGMIFRYYITGIEKLFSKNKNYKKKFNELKQYIFDEDVSKAAGNAKQDRIVLRGITYLARKKKVRTLYFLFLFNNIKRNLRPR